MNRGIAFLLKREKGQTLWGQILTSHFSAISTEREQARKSYFENWDACRVGLWWKLRHIFVIFFVMIVKLSALLISFCQLQSCLVGYQCNHFQHFYGAAKWWQNVIGLIGCHVEECDGKAFSNNIGFNPARTIISINIVSEYQSHDKFTTQNVFSYLKSTISISKVQIESSTLPRCIDLPTTNFKACGAFSLFNND